jgi:1-phosphofructokinase
VSVADSAADAPREVVTVTPNPAIDWTLTIPGFTAGAVNRVESQHSTAGGKGVNVAGTLAGAGHRVAVTGWLGRANAAVFEALFAERGIEDRFVRVSGETRMGIKLADPDNQQTTDVNLAGLAPAAHERAELFERVLRLAGGAADAARWFVLAGSLPPGVATNMYCELATLVQAAGSHVLLDTSGEPLRRALEARPRILKPNLHELQALAGAPLTTRKAVIAAARALLQGDTELVVVSMGAEGALFVSAGRIVAATPPAVTVRTTVGAGDAMVAGIVSARLRGLDLPATARLSTAFALESVTREPSGTISPERVEPWLSRIVVEEVG